MKKLAVTIAFTSLIAAANAVVDLRIDNPYPVATPPSSGSIRVLFTGSIDVLQPGYVVTSASLSRPSDRVHPSLNVDFDPALSAAIFTNTLQHYSGNLFTVEVLSTTQPGDYIYAGGQFCDMSVSVAQPNGSNPATDREFFGVIVQPVPEPVSLIGLGLGALILARRRSTHCAFRREQASIPM